jgi:hypothetical protein
MKILNTLQELWSHCLFCPICRDVIREVSVSVGPDDAFTIKKWEKENHILHLHCTFKAKKQKYKTVYHINCLDNSFTVDISEPVRTTERADGASAPYFFFYIFSDCKKCNNTHTNSSDLELDLLNKKVTNIGLEREGIYLLSEKDKYHLTICHDSNEIELSKMFHDDALGTLVDDNNVISLPLIEFDYSNVKKVINKIKTLLVFS